MITNEALLMWCAFISVSSMVLMVALLFTKSNPSPVPAGRRFDPPDDWADSTEGSLARRSAMHRMGTMIMPEESSKVSRLKSKLMQAGLYKRHSTGFFLAIKLILMLSPMFVGLLLAVCGLMDMSTAILFGAVVGLVGNLAPALWLARWKGERQRNMRRSLPDALDVIVICMEGGLSLQASLVRVASELKYAHPLLASEMLIVQREIKLGRSTGESLKQLADRFDLDELRSLASVVNQTERFGASLAKALVVHADALRMRRYQFAEAMAQKAPVKLVFPTVLCIFPALYVVLMGPAGVQLLKMLNDL